MNKLIYIFFSICITFFSSFLTGKTFAASEENKDFSMQDKSDDNVISNLCGGISSAQIWLDKGADPNAFILNGFTPLTFIPSEPKCHNADLSNLINLLISRGADVNKKDKFGTPPIIAAAQDGAFEIIKLYLPHKVNVNAVDGRGYNALMCFAYSDKENTIKKTQFLLDIGLDPSIVAPDGRTSLNWGAASSYTEVFNLIKRAQEKQIQK